MLTLGLSLALFAQATSAPPGNDQIYYSITLQDQKKGEAAKSQSMKIGSFAWGAGEPMDSPPPTGSVIVKVELPWTECEVGANYPSLSLAGGGKRYAVQDVTISKCEGSPAESVTFDYKSVAVKAADAPKKE